MCLTVKFSYIQVVAASVWYFDIAFWMLKEESSVTVWRQKSRDTRLGNTHLFYRIYICFAV